VSWPKRRAYRGRRFNADLQLSTAPAEMATTMRLIATFVLLAYSAALVRLLVFKNVLIQLGTLRFRFDQEAAGQANFLPLKTISSYLLGEHGRLIAIINLIGNIALFVPIGFLVPFVYQKMTWQWSVALGVAASLAIEGMEMVFHTGVFDIDDVMLNAIGVTLGYLAFSISVKRKPSRQK
jgi:glycopeptide antibiotics resistance protein